MSIRSVPDISQMLLIGPLPQPRLPAYVRLHTKGKVGVRERSLERDNTSQLVPRHQNEESCENSNTNLDGGPVFARERPLCECICGSTERALNSSEVGEESMNC